MGGAVGTGLAPEAGIGEAAGEFGIAPYAAGSAMKDSISINNMIFNGGNGSGFDLSTANDFILKNVPELFRDIGSSILEKAENQVGLTKGDTGGVLTSLKRAGYYAILGIAGAFFLVHLIFWRRSSSSFDYNLVKTTALIVVIFVLYITKFDKEYLIRSIPLRVLIVVTGLLGMVIVATSMAR